STVFAATTTAFFVIVTKLGSDATTTYIPAGSSIRNDPSSPQSTCATSRADESFTTIWAPGSLTVPDCVVTSPCSTPVAGCDQAAAGRNRLQTMKWRMARTSLFD